MKNNKMIRSLTPAIHDKLTEFVTSAPNKASVLLLWLGLTFLSIGLRAQNTADSTAVSTEVVDIVKSYTPSINLRPKSKWNLSDSERELTPRPEFNYSHEVLGFYPTDLPAVLSATNLEKQETKKYLSNYIRVMMGTRASAGVEGFLAHEINRDNYLSAALEHQQINGPIDGVALPADWAETGLRTQWRSKLMDRTATLGLSLRPSAVQWYGVPDTMNLDTYLLSDFGQIYHRGTLSHRLGSNGSWFSGLDSELSLFSDQFGVTEWNFSSAPRVELLWDKRQISIDGRFSLLSTKFSLDDDLITTEDYTAVNADLGAQADLALGDLKVNFGASVWAHNAGEESTLRLFPKLGLNYPILTGILNAYFDFDGQYNQYQTSTLTQNHAFLAPGQRLKPNIDRQIVRLGFNGALNDLWQYSLGLEYRNFDDQAYFTRRPWSGQQGTFAYDNGNSYTIFYDDGSELKYSAKINGRLSERWDIALDAAVIDNRPANGDEAWNIPAFSFGGSGSYHINDQLLLTGRFVSYGSRVDQLNLADAVSTQNVDGFIDAQLHFNYAITKNFSASLSGINLLNQSNGLWVNYPVQGLRVNLGLQYNFAAF